MRLQQFSENALLLQFHQKIDAEQHSYIVALAQNILTQLGSVVQDVVVSYASILVQFQLLKISAPLLKKYILQIADSTKVAQKLNGKLVKIPVLYHDEVGFDSAYLCAQKNITLEQLVDLHSCRDYDVYAIGFAPGFAYLGQVADEIAVPRKKTPRKNVPSGSVGIAGHQTAVYPIDSPGGWQIIGRTPSLLLDYSDAMLTPLRCGDKVRFYPITKKQFLKQGGVL